eukprot:gene57473-biopygen1853
MPYGKPSTSPAAATARPAKPAGFPEDLEDFEDFSDGLHLPGDVTCTTVGGDALLGCPHAHGTADVAFLPHAVDGGHAAGGHDIVVACWVILSRCSWDPARRWAVGCRTVTDADSVCGNVLRGGFASGVVVTSKRSPTPTWTNCCFAHTPRRALRARFARARTRVRFAHAHDTSGGMTDTATARARLNNNTGPSSGPVLGQFWPSSGPVLGQFWTSTGPALDQFWVSSGTVLAQFWASSGPVLGQSWAS